MQAPNMPKLNTANNAAYAHTWSTVLAREKAQLTHTVGFVHMIYMHDLSLSHITAQAHTQQSSLWTI